MPKEEIKIENLVFKYWSILKLLDDEKFLNKEEFIEKELLLYKEEINGEISKIISKNFNNDFKNVYVINEGDILLDVNNRYSLQIKASELMGKHFNKTIKINNELINKNVITSTMKSVESKVINRLWDSLKNNSKFKFKKFNSEYTTARTVLLNSKILTLNDDYTVNVNYKSLSKDEPIRLVFEVILKFLNDCKKRKKISMNYTRN